MNAKVKREGDKVWIPSVKVWTAPQMPNSVMAAHAMAMKIMGEDISYAYLMGTSGSAFRVQLHEEWCPSSPHSFCGFQTVRGAMAALPYKVVVYEVKKEDAEGVEKARQAVVESVNKGWPCVYGREEDGLILGYQNLGKEWLCNHPYKPNVFKPEAYFVEKDWPWGVAVYTAKRDPPADRRKCAVESLKLAVKLANTEKAGDYLCGFNAWQTWMTRLRDDALFGKTDEKAVRAMMHGNAWIYQNLMDARACAADYLKSVRGEFEGDAAAHVAKAAGFYEEIAQKLRSGGKHAPYPHRLGDKPWTREMRHAQADVLEQCVILERRAIAEIVKVLDSLNL